MFVSVTSINQNIFTICPESSNIVQTDFLIRACYQVKNECSMLEHYYFHFTIFVNLKKAAISNFLKHMVELNGVEPSAS